MAEVEPAADRLQRGGAADASRPGGHAADQRAGARRPTRRARTGSATTAPPPGPTWPRAGTTGARSTPRCTTSTSASTRRRSRCARARRSCGGRAGARRNPDGRPGVDDRVRRRPPRGHALRQARDLPPRRRRRAAPGVLPGAVRARVPQLDARLPEGVRDPGRRRAAQRRRGEPPGRVGAVQRHRGRRDRARLPLRLADVRGGLVRHLDGTAAARPRRHRAERRRRHLGAHPAAVRAAGGVEPRLSLGRRHGHDPRRRELLAADGRDPPGEPPQGLAAARQGQGLHAGDRLTDGSAYAQQRGSRGRRRVDRGRGLQRRAGRNGRVRLRP